MDQENKRKIGKIAVVALLLGACALTRSYTLTDTSTLEDYKKAYNGCMVENKDLKTELIEAMDIIKNLLNCPK